MPTSSICLPFCTRQSIPACPHVICNARLPFLVLIPVDIEQVPSRPYPAAAQAQRPSSGSASQPRSYWTEHGTWVGSGPVGHSLGSHSTATQSVQVWLCLQLQGNALLVEVAAAIARKWHREAA